MRLKLKCAFKEGPSNTAKRIFFVVGGRGGTPNPVQKNSTKKQVILFQKLQTFLDNSMVKIFGDFPLKGGGGEARGVPPIRVSQKQGYSYSSEPPKHVIQLKC